MTPIELAIEALELANLISYSEINSATFAAAIAALRAQPDHSELAKDAARYRWLRTWEIDSYFATGKLELNAEIDRAMAADALEGKV